MFVLETKLCSFVVVWLVLVVSPPNPVIEIAHSILNFRFL